MTYNPYRTVGNPDVDEALERICEQMKMDGVAVAVAAYDGSNDEGFVQTVMLYETTEDYAEKVSGRLCTPNYDGRAVQDRIERYCYAYLSKHHGGWEINDGSKGTVTINAIDRTVTNDHHWGYSGYY